MINTVGKLEIKIRMFLTQSVLITILFLINSPGGSEGAVNKLIGVANRVEKSSNRRDRNETGVYGIQNEGINEVERDIIISVLILACITPIICGSLMLACQLSSQVKRKHINRRLRINQQQVAEECNDTLDVIRKMGPLQLHESFPQFINGISREEMECYMNRSAIAREMRGYMSTSAMRNNPETGQVEGHEERMPVTPPHVTMLPRIAVQYPSPVMKAANTNLYSPIEEFTYNLYPPLPVSFRNGTPIFTAPPKNSTPRSPKGATASPKPRPSIRETPGRSRHDRSITLLRTMAMSPPPNYNLIDKNKDCIGNSLPCLLNSYRTSPYINLNLSMSGAGGMKDRSSSENDVSA